MMTVRPLLVLLLLAAGLTSAPFFSMEQRSDEGVLLVSTPYAGQGTPRIETARASLRDVPTVVQDGAGPAAAGVARIGPFLAPASTAEPLSPLPSLGLPARRPTYWATAPPAA